MKLVPRFRGMDGSFSAIFPTGSGGLPLPFHGIGVLAGLATRLDPTWVAMGGGRTPGWVHEAGIRETGSPLGRVGPSAPPTPDDPQDAS
jgi:hypothetical protein